MSTLREGGRYFRCRYDCAERATVTDSFCHRHNVRNHPLCFETPVMCAGPTKSRLHFIGDAQATGCADVFVDIFEGTIREYDTSPHAWNCVRDKRRVLNGLG